MKIGKYDSLQACAKALNVSVSYLVGADDEADNEEEKKQTRYAARAKISGSQETAEEKAGFYSSVSRHRFRE